MSGWSFWQTLGAGSRLDRWLDALAIRLAGADPESSPAAAGVPPVGLPVGAPAPAFKLPGVFGETLTLEALRAPGKPVLLLFVAPDDTACDALLAEAAHWQQAHQDRCAIALVSRGPLAANRTRATHRGLTNLLLERDGRVAAAYQVRARPAAVLVRADGTIGSALARGPGPVRALVSEALRDQVPSAGHPAAEWFVPVAQLVDPAEQAHAQLSQGLLLLGQGRPDEAVRRFQRAIELRPDYAEAHYNLGNALHAQGKLTAAAASFRGAIELRPDVVENHVNLGVVLGLEGEPELAVASFRRALALRPDFAAAQANLVLTRHYEAACDRTTLAAEVRAWANTHAAPLAARARPHFNSPDPDRRLRVGYVSADFWQHPVGLLMEAVLPAHDPAQVEVFCYANSAREDAVTARLRAAAHHWRSLVSHDDEAAAELIRADAIDILVDLAGHTSGQRLLVFARKPAPVQATWLGNASSSGVGAVDYLIADPVVCPTGDEGLYTEEVLRLPDAYLCYAPPAFGPAVGPPPARARGHVTFGCFNNLAKVTPVVVALWARLLHAVPEARLLLKTAALDDPGVRERYTRLFAEQQIATDRLSLLGHTSLDEHLALYGEIDIALDPFPYNGCLTSLETLWMGVPLVALAGDRFVSRVGMSLLTTIGLPELIGESPEEYVGRAASLARDLDRLEALRAGLRARLEQSPLCDRPRFARAIEAAYRATWRRWCAERTAG